MEFATVCELSVPCFVHLDKGRIHKIILTFCTGEECSNAYKRELDATGRSKYVSWNVNNLSAGFYVMNDVNEQIEQEKKGITESDELLSLYDEKFHFCNECKTRCLKGKVLQVCGRCKGVKYCDRLCQANDWINHKLVCAHKSTKTAKREKSMDFDEAIVIVLQNNSAPRFCKRKDSPFKSGDFDHVTLLGLEYAGYKLGMFIEARGRDNTEAKTIVQYLRHQFTVIGASDVDKSNIAGAAIIYDDQRDMTPEIWEKMQSEIKRKKKQ
jgi:hypothetical protein